MAAFCPGNGTCAGPAATGTCAPPPEGSMRRAPKHLEDLTVGLTRNTSRAMQRQIDLATAMAQEKLLDTHVRHVLALVELTAGQLPFDTALDIYARVLRLNPEQARNVGSRAFAELGRRGVVQGGGSE